ncbi:uncharacterized protein LOC108625978, partial [Ceratina calcarata]|uniref:Uncharacterized protein LOC108625978 n=1 Tax=Ceratina calcarata TaxID=156304 RepID=A0AAJ7N7T0_9HYME
HRVAPVNWSTGLEVTGEELERAVSRMKRGTAPGPDGIPGRALALAVATLGDGLRQMFNTCLRHSTFPTSWKEARMVLLKKEGRPADSPSAYRPICLLDETGKLFERVLAARLVQHLSRDGPDLADCQYGFRQGRSTMDAILRVRSLSEQAVSQGKVALGVSLDVTNAFNTVPWEKIREALVAHRVPPYLREVIGSYLSDRRIHFVGRYGELHHRVVDCGVPQGSVLGPLLWNLAYDAVLRADLPHGVYVICYADDIFILAVEEDFGRTIRLAEVAVATVVARIHALGLSVSEAKTEAMFFHGLPRRSQPPPSWIRVGDSYVRVSQYIKYLGLTLDGRWCFDEHFDRLAPRLLATANALCGILPNLGGPRESVRRLYLGVVRSMALYGAPVWSADLVASRRSLDSLRRVQRRLAIRVVRGYRTISYEAATLLSRFPP